MTMKRVLAHGMVITLMIIICASEVNRRRQVRPVPTRGNTDVIQNEDSSVFEFDPRSFTDVEVVVIDGDTVMRIIDSNRVVASMEKGILTVTDTAAVFRAIAKVKHFRDSSYRAQDSISIEAHKSTL